MIGVIAVATLIILAVIAVVYAFTFAGTISPSHLVTETVGSSTYLRPQQWTSSPDMLGEGVSSFGDWPDRKNETVSAMVVFREAATMPEMVRASDVAIAKLRQEFAASQNQDTVIGDGSAACASMTNSKPQMDTKKSAAMTGLVTFSSACQRKDGQVMTTRIRIAIGSDGTLRVISVTANEAGWKKSRATFETMLGSVEQVVEVNS